MVDQSVRKAWGRGGGLVELEVKSQVPSLRMKCCSTKPEITLGWELLTFHIMNMAELQMYIQWRVLSVSFFFHINLVAAVSLEIWVFWQSIPDTPCQCYSGMSANWIKYPNINYYIHGRFTKCRDPLKINTLPNDLWRFIFPNSYITQHTECYGAWDGEKGIIH